MIISITFGGMHTANQPDITFQIYYLSEGAITIEFGREIAGDIVDAVNSFNSLLVKKPFPGWETTLPAYATLTVYFDPLKVIRSDLPGAGCLEKVSNYLYFLNEQEQVVSVNNGATITIPVCYGNKFGPDLEEVANLHQLTIDEVINLHSSVIYRVYMIGFTPGFAYLGGMDERIASPRKAMPRKAVPAGSVGIAGGQTGVYPLETPGGWQIIGQTPVKLFDVNRAQSSLFKAGDKVVFKPISNAEFNQLSAG